MKEIAEIKIFKILQSCLLTPAQQEAVMNRLSDIVSIYEKDR